MDFDTKLVVILRDDLQPWQELNVTAFLMTGIGATQSIVGDIYIDRSGVEYLPMSQQPILVFTATKDKMQEILKKSLTKDVKMTIYTQELFNTFNDEDNRNAVAQFNTEELNLVGMGIHGKKNHVTKLTKGLELHK